MDIDRSLKTGPVEACDRVQFYLPVLRTMRVLVTPHLHSGVTHILCDLIDDVRTIDVVDVDAETFRYPAHKAGFTQDAALANELAGSIIWLPQVTSFGHGTILRAAEL